MQNNCESIGTCGGCALGLFSSVSQLGYKVALAKDSLEKFDIKQFDIFETTNIGFRSRAEFRIFHKNGCIKYAMTSFDKKLFTIDGCVIVDKHIQDIMPQLLRLLDSDDVLSKKLFCVEFLNSTQNDMIATLIYHKKLDDIWQTKATQLQEYLGINIIGRSRKQKIVLGSDTIQNQLKVGDKTYFYDYQDTTFVQPNHEINQKMINFIQDHITAHGDMVELYCGAGNFAIALAHKFEKVLATEINKSSIKLAKQNAKLNNTTNIKFVRLSSSEFSQAVSHQREFRRLAEQNIDIRDYGFDTILIDPPRAGVDDETLKILEQYKQIIYISCSVDSLCDNLNTLTKTHNIKKFAFFDQFMWSLHIESIVIMEKNSV
jgi:tRNA (uracil-5-)-methyltransferase